MNPEARLYGIPTHQHGCGRIAMDNVRRTFWQSRAGFRDPPELTDLHQLAKDIRNAPAAPAAPDIARVATAIFNSRQASITSTAARVATTEAISKR